MKIRLEITYKPKQGKKAYDLKTDFMEVTEALLFSDDLEKTGRVTDIVFLDQHDSTWLKKQLKKYLDSLKEEPHHITAYFDGGFNKSERLAGVGIAIYFEQNNKHLRLRKNAKLEQLISNNEAEFAALWTLVTELEALGVHHQSITIKGDSLVAINQASGEWPCYEEEHSRWLDLIDEKIQTLDLNVTYELIKRNDNKETDHLATQALAGTMIDALGEVNN